MDDHGLLIELSETEVGNEPDHQYQVTALVRGLQDVLQWYQKVFAASTTLPPISDQDHAIKLEHETGPINVRPYRYPQF